MLHKRFAILRPLGVLVSLVGLLALFGAAQAGPAAQPARADPPQDKMIYLPLASKLEDYRGQVTLNGAPAAGRTVTLRYWNGFSYSDWATTTTNAAGNYSFPANTLPPIGGGKDFYVRWTNDSQTIGYLAGWYCENVVSAPADNYVCNMDIGDIRLGSPLGAVSINLPYTFTWTRRPVATDSYQVEFYFYDSVSLDLRHTSGLLGYAAQWTMTILPANMTVGTQYWWSMIADGPNGYGEAFYIRSLRFNDTSSPPLNSLPGELPRSPGAAREARP